MGKWKFNASIGLWGIHMKIKSLFITLLLLTLAYCILSGDFSLTSVLVALFISALSLFLTRILWGEKLAEGNTFRIMHFFFYILILLKTILTSGIYTAKLILTTKTKCTYLEYSTNLDYDYQVNILANSITLTPGTVTIKKLNKKLCVMQLLKHDDGIDIEGIRILENRIRKISTK